MIRGAEGDRQFLAALSENAALTTEAILNGSEQADMFKAGDGTIYVLMYLPKSTFVTELTKKASTFNRTSSAASTQKKKWPKPTKNIFQQTNKLPAVAARTHLCQRHSIK